MAYINGNDFRWMLTCLMDRHNAHSIKSGLSEIEILVKMNSYLIST
ncbi:hypothetical protein T10_6684 [Trichinella papuae]|uniref:Uncharacterized protein n=1 Tax=Trichinella papuae TaxID=268474 RepID=A0A0V1LXG1_9BILA|nr:hypothetical protein T10_6684 [Trichinella papuae]